MLEVKIASPSSFLIKFRAKTSNCKKLLSSRRALKMTSFDTHVTHQKHVMGGLWKGGVTADKANAILW